MDKSQERIIFVNGFDFDQIPISIAIHICYHHKGVKLCPIRIFFNIHLEIIFYREIFTVFLIVIQTFSLLITKVIISY